MELVPIQQTVNDFLDTTDATWYDWFGSPQLRDKMAEQMKKDVAEYLKSTGIKYGEVVVVFRDFLKSEIPSIQHVVPDYSRFCRVLMKDFLNYLKMKELDMY